MTIHSLLHLSLSSLLTDGLVGFGDRLIISVSTLIN